MKSTGLQILTSWSVLIFLVWCMLLEANGLQRDDNNSIVELNLTISNSSVLLYNITFTNVTDDNITEFENSTDNETLTTILPAITTLPAEEDLVDRKTLVARKLGFENFCTCDLNANSCDINCCCDEECSLNDKEAFSQCLSTSYKPADKRYCFQDEILSANNTDYKTKKSDDGLFCIITDNLEDANVFPLIESLKTVEEFNVKGKIGQNPSWFYHRPGIDKVAQRNYVHGTPVLAVADDGTTYDFELPSALLSSNCEQAEKILYMTNYEAFCELPAIPNLKDCEHHPLMNVGHFIKIKFLGEVIPPKIPEVNITTTEAPTVNKATSPITLTSSPTNGTISMGTSTSVLIPNANLPTTPTPATLEPVRASAPSTNDTKTTHTSASLLEKSPENFDETQIDSLLTTYKLVPVNFTICEYLSSLQFHNCVEKEIPKVCCQYGECKNVLQAIELKFLHNGTSGIQKVEAKVFLAAVNAAKTFHQYFRVSFQRIDENETEIFHRSGKPGYITGRPILLGRLFTNESIEDDSEGQSWIEMDKDPENWVTLLSTSSDFSCTKRIQVNFNENVRTGCLISVPAEQITNNCKELRKNLLSFLLGPILESIEDLKIGMYGDSNINIPEEWTTLLFEENLRKVLNYELDESAADAGCRNVITSIEIEIAYVYQGPFANPQAMIVGAMVRSGHFHDLPPPCSKGLICSRLSEEEKNHPTIIELSSSVIFTDVSKAAERQYPRPPAFDFKLPYDFFYPFLPSIASSNNYRNMELIVLQCFAKILFYFVLKK